MSTIYSLPKATAQTARGHLTSHLHSLNTFTMNQEKLQQLQAQVRIGGKGTARRKKKVINLWQLLHD